MFSYKYLSNIVGLKYEPYTLLLLDGTYVPRKILLVYVETKHKLRRKKESYRRELKKL